jgi:hypothetical protein
MKIIDRKRAPVLQEKPRAELPARAERESILARARAAVASRELVPAPPPPVESRPRAPASSKAPVRNLPALVKRRSSVPTRTAARSAPARQGQPRPSAGPAAGVPAAQNRMEVPPGQTAAAVQNSGSGQTIIVQVSAPQPSYPWWGPWWGYSPAGCGARSCPRRVGQVCTRWLCGW